MDEVESRARRIITQAIVKAHKTNDCAYYARLDAASLEVYEALVLNNLQNILTSMQELELLLTEKKDGTFIERTENIRANSKN